jgi:hypothetical protein
MNNAISDLARSLPGVELAELDAVAALLIRRDRKYVVPAAQAAAALVTLDGARMLDIDGRRRFRYQSVYFDSPELVSFLGAARCRPRRFKVRTRTYLDSGLGQLEVKTRDRRGMTVKRRIPHDPAAAAWLGHDGLDFVAGVGDVGGETVARALRPTLTTAYTRSTLLLPDGARLTVDTDLRAWDEAGSETWLPGLAIIETKGSGAPSDADRALWAAGHRPVRISKYCTSLAALEPWLPSNRWTRALQRPWLVERADVDPGVMARAS